MLSMPCHYIIKHIFVVIVSCIAYNYYDKHSQHTDRVLISIIVDVSERHYFEQYLLAKKYNSLMYSLFSNINKFFLKRKCRVNQLTGFISPKPIL